MQTWGCEAAPGRLPQELGLRPFPWPEHEHAPGVSPHSALPLSPEA